MLAADNRIRMADVLADRKKTCAVTAGMR